MKGKKKKRFKRKEGCYGGLCGGGRAQGKLDYVRGRYPEGRGGLFLGRVPGWEDCLGAEVLSIFICL